MSFKNTLVGLLAVVGIAVSLPAMGYIFVIFARWCGDPFFQENNFNPTGSIVEAILTVGMGAMLIGLFISVLHSIPRILKSLDKLGYLILIAIRKK